MKREDSWSLLKAKTAARIALGRAGGSLPTKAWLDFRYAHAKARDAVFRPLDFELVMAELRSAGIESSIVETCAKHQQEFLLRPDKGRILELTSLENISKIGIASPKGARPRVGITLSAGLSAAAAMANGVAVIKAIWPALSARGYEVGPLFLTRFGRVALGDQIGTVLKADLMIMLIGERPGLDTAESLGAYLTYNPTKNSSDADRNCVSNIHSRGLTPEAAAAKILWLVNAAITAKTSGIAIKDGSDEAKPLPPNQTWEPST